MSRLVQVARGMARVWHGDQKRKYTGEPYYVHCEEVAQLVENIGGSDNVVAAALLHDVLEDTNATPQEIGDIFGEAVLQLVQEVTDISRPGMGNRLARKAIDRMHLANASADGKTIKLADIISNTRSIVQHDKDFAVVYLREIELLLPLLREGNAKLYFRAWQAVVSGFFELREVRQKEAA